MLIAIECLIIHLRVQFLIQLAMNIPVYIDCFFGETSPHHTYKIKCLKLPGLSQQPEGCSFWGKLNVKAGSRAAMIMFVLALRLDLVAFFPAFL